MFNCNGLGLFHCMDAWRHTAPKRPMSAHSRKSPYFLNCYYVKISFDFLANLFSQFPFRWVFFLFFFMPTHISKWHGIASEIGQITCGKTVGRIPHVYHAAHPQSICAKIVRFQVLLNSAKAPCSLSWPLSRNLFLQSTPLSVTLPQCGTFGAVNHIFGNNKVWSATLARRTL